MSHFWSLKYHQSFGIHWTCVCGGGGDEGMSDGETEVNGRCGGMGRRRDIYGRTSDKESVVCILSTRIVND